MRELWDQVSDGDAAPELAFSRENGGAILRRYFPRVEERPMSGVATFPDHDSAVRHIRASLTRAHLADALSSFAGTLRVTTSNTMFIAHM
jgi:hypothetical protein